MTLTDVPESRAGEWCFHLFGVEVRVKFWFWLVTLLFCGNRDTRTALIWMAVCFVSIVLHEMGHVVALRLFGTKSYAVLYWLGGVAIPDREVRGTLAEFVVAMAGPAAGFCVAGLVLAGAQIAGAPIHFGWPMLQVGPLQRGQANLWYVLVNDLILVNFFWAVFNLLPVLPLDGGNATRAVLERRDPYNGKRTSLLVSALAGAAVALAGAFAGNLYVILLFGVLAALSAQQAEGERRRGAPR
jgi:stage IV sporulation protein FB